MKRIDTGRAANAYGGPAGGTGHWQDTDPTGGTQFDAEWCEGVQEALCGAIEGLGGTLSGDETAQLWGLLGPRVQGQLAHATDTGVASTAQTRVLVASMTCQADALESACVASQDSLAHGIRSLVASSSNSAATGGHSAAIACPSGSASGAGSAAIACTDPVTSGDESAQGALSFAAASLNSKATGAQSAVIASEGCVAAGESSAAVASEGCAASGKRSACLASYGSEAVDDNSLVLNSLASFASSGAAGQSTVMTSTYCENVEPLTVALGYGAAPITKTGANQNRKIVLYAATGDIKMVGKFDQLSVATGTNEPAGTVTGPTDLSTPVVTVINNTRVAAGSQIFATFEDTTSPATGAGVTCTVETRVANTSFAVRTTCVTGTFSGTSVIHYWILNPVKAATV